MSGEKLSVVDIVICSIFSAMKNRHITIAVYTVGIVTFTVIIKEILQSLQDTAT